MINYEFSDDSKLSFKGCPNGCHNGKYIDLYNHRYVECEYCAKIRKTLSLDDNTVEYQDIDTLLRTQGTFHGDSFDSDAILLDSRKDRLTSTQKVQFERVKSLMDDIVSKYNAGTLPDKSYVISLGRACRPMDFHVACLKKGYQAGLTVVPFCDRYEIARVLQNRLVPDDDIYLTPYISERDLLNNQVCVIQLMGSLLEDEVDLIFSLVRLRGQRKLPTVVITDCNASKTATGKLIIDNATRVESEASYEIPYAISVIQDEYNNDSDSFNLFTSL